MKSSYLTNLILLTIVVILLWVSQRDKPASDPVPSLSTLSAESVNQLQIERKGKPTISLQRHQQVWQLTQPFSARANQTRVNLLLSLLSSPVHGQLQAMDKDALGQFGLAQPRVTLSMNSARFAFGNVESLSENRYVLHQGTVYLIQDDVTPLLNASAGSFVDNRLIADNSEITKLSIPASADSKTSIEIHQRNGSWHSDSTTLTSDALKTLVDNWESAYAMQVRHINAEQVAGLPAPQIRLWLQGQSQPVQLIMTQNAQNLQLINPALQLQYDFPLALQSQLLAD